MKATALRMATALVVSALAGCTVGPDFVAPQTETPEEWSNGAPLSHGLSTKSEPDPKWWRSFGDAKLNELIDEAGSADQTRAQSPSRVP